MSELEDVGAITRACFQGCSGLEENAQTEGEVFGDAKDRRKGTGFCFVAFYCSVRQEGPDAATESLNSIPRDVPAQEGDDPLTVKTETVRKFSPSVMRYSRDGGCGKYSPTG